MMAFDLFVFVHLAKTGGTFVEHVLKSLHCPSKLGQKIHSMRRRVGIKIPLYPYKYQEYRKHSLCKAISPEHQHKVIMACIRNPYDLYISHYKFGWWRQHPEQYFVQDTEMYRRCLDAPDQVTFGDWVQGINQDGNWVHTRRATLPGVEVGFAASEFASYFSRDPNLVLGQPTEPEMAAAFERTKYNVTFLRMESLNESLYRFLVEVGYPGPQVGFIRTMGKIYPGKQTRSSSDSVQHVYTPELKALIRQKERLLFAIFPEYDR